VLVRAFPDDVRLGCRMVLDAFPKVILPTSIGNCCCGFDGQVNIR
jgi:hypothetical protein